MTTAIDCSDSGEERPKADLSQRLSILCPCGPNSVCLLESSGEIIKMERAVHLSYNIKQYLTEMAEKHTHTMYLLSLVVGRFFFFFFEAFQEFGHGKVCFQGLKAN